MFRSLRNRLIFSHILPALLIIPLMGAAMVYILETRLLLPMIYQNLAREASLMAEMTRTQPIFWQNRIAAQALANGVSPYLNGKVSLLTLDGRLLASSDQTATEYTTGGSSRPDRIQPGRGPAIAEWSPGGSLYPGL